MPDIVGLELGRRRWYIECLAPHTVWRLWHPANLFPLPEEDLDVLRVCLLRECVFTDEGDPMVEEPSVVVGKGTTLCAYVGEWCPCRGVGW